MQQISLKLLLSYINPTHFMKTKEQTSSFLTEQQPQYIPAQKQPQQIKALFLKNLRLQSKQIGTNICQIITPIICLLFTIAIRQMAVSNMPVGAKYLPNSYPYIFNNYSYIDEKTPLIKRNPLQWFAYTCEKECNETILGSKDGENPPSGMLGKIPDSFPGVISYYPQYFNNETDVRYVKTPFLKQLNKTINEDLFERLNRLNKVQNKIISKQFGLDYLPDGAVSIKVLNDTNLQAKLSINDARNLDYHRNNGLTKLKDYRKNINGQQKLDVSFNPAQGMLYMVHMMSASFIQYVTGEKTYSGYVYMPDNQEGVSFVDTLINTVAAIIFPIGLGLMFPVFLYTIVLQKQQRLIQMMKMNGMKISNYWFVFFLFNFIIGLVTNLVFVAFGYLFLDIRFFSQTSPVLIAVVLLGWLLSQIGMAAFFQTFLSEARTANIVGYLISIWTMMIAASLNLGVYQYPSPYPSWMQLVPPLAFVRLFYDMLTVCSSGQCYASIADISDQMRNCILTLYIGFIFFFLLGAYLFQIIPQQYGVNQSPLFPFKMIKSLVSADKPDLQIGKDEQLRDYIDVNEEDQLSKQQRHKVLSLQSKELQYYPLVINNLRKIYKKQGHDGPFVAVKSFNLMIDRKETFGLLGPNGAGKTTLISMITGMFKPNFGNAWIGGYDIQTNVARAQLQMGVCPQFDLLWPQLTVQEHLYFYARLKGVPGSQIKKKVQSAMEQVKLLAFRGFKSRSLSGGMKRRLSVAISLVGDPRIVFLDQPSTGLDPDNRRQLWQVLAKCQSKRALFLTTHMMQEADTLCHRVGIITKGILRTVGSQINLKKKYGDGYRLNMNILKQDKKLIDRQSLKDIQGQNNIEDLNGQAQQNFRNSLHSFVEMQDHQIQKKKTNRIGAIESYMNKTFPGSKLLKSFKGTIIFKVPTNFKISFIFETFEKIQKDLDIADIAITNSSLQDVFMNVVLKFQINARLIENSEEPQKIKVQPKQDSFKSYKNSRQNVLVDPDPYGSVVTKKRQSIMSNQNLNQQPQNNNREDNKNDDDDDDDQSQPHRQSQYSDRRKSYGSNDS